MTTVLRPATTVNPNKPQKRNTSQECSRALKSSKLVQDFYSLPMSFHPSATWISRDLKSSTEFSRVFKKGYSLTRVLMRVARYQDFSRNQEISRVLQSSHPSGNFPSIFLQTLLQSSQAFSKVLVSSQEFSLNSTILQKSSHSIAQYFSRRLKSCHTIAQQFSRVLKTLQELSRALTQQDIGSQELSRLLSRVLKHARDSSSVLAQTQTSSQEFSRVLKSSQEFSHKSTILLEIFRNSHPRAQYFSRVLKIC
jgi:methyl-accepting chemotaxis protein